MIDAFLLDSELRTYGVKVNDMRLHGASEDDVAAFLASVGWDEKLAQWRAAR